MENRKALFDFELRSKVWQVYQSNDKNKHLKYDQICQKLLISSAFAISWEI